MPHIEARFFFSNEIIKSEHSRYLLSVFARRALCDPFDWTSISNCQSQAGFSRKQVKQSFINFFFSFQSHIVRENLNLKNIKPSSSAEGIVFLADENNIQHKKIIRFPTFLTRWLCLCRRCSGLIFSAHSQATQTLSRCLDAIFEFEYKKIKKLANLTLKLEILPFDIRLLSLRLFIGFFDGVTSHPSSINVDDLRRPSVS